MEVQLQGSGSQTPTVLFKRKDQLPSFTRIRKTDQVQKYSYTVVGGMWWDSTEGESRSQTPRKGTGAH